MASEVISWRNYNMGVNKPVISTQSLRALRKKHNSSDSEYFHTSDLDYLCTLEISSVGIKSASLHLTEKFFFAWLRYIKFRYDFDIKEWAISMMNYWTRDNNWAGIVDLLDTNLDQTIIFDKLIYRPKNSTNDLNRYSDGFFVSGKGTFGTPIKNCSIREIMEELKIRAENLFNMMSELKNSDNVLTNKLHMMHLTYCKFIAEYDDLNFYD